MSPILRKYGVLLTTAKAITFSLYEVDGIDLRVDATFATGDVTISKDGGTEVSTTNLPVDEGKGYSLILTLAELQASQVRISIVDQTGTKAWLDTELMIETYGNASAMHEFDLGTASVPQTADHTAAIADLPTVAEFEARTIVSANYSTSSALAVVDTDVGKIITAVITNAAGVDISDDISNIPTVAEFNARTIPSANYFDFTSDFVQVGTNNDKTGYSISGVLNTLDDLENLAQTDVVTSGAIQTAVGVVVNVGIVENLNTIDDGAIKATTIEANALDGKGDWNIGKTGYELTVTPPTAIQNRQEMDSNSTQLAAIVLDTGTTIPTQISALNDLSASDIENFQLTESYAADGVAPTFGQSMFMIQQFQKEHSSAGVTKTVKGLDGITTVMTFTYDDATNPTSLTRTT